MLDDQELEALFDHVESDRVERKSALAADKIRQAICAFANDLPGHGQPGVVFVGVNDNGSCAGLPITERRLAEKRIAGDLPFDQHRAFGATIEDLDIHTFQREYLPNAVSHDVLVENDRPVEQQLKSLRFLTRDGVPTVSAVLVLGKDPLGSIPGAYVQFLRIDGTNLTDPIRHQAAISGPLHDVIRQVEELITANISIGTDLSTGITEVKRPDYPIVALQQLYRNAILHRNYDSTAAPTRITWFQDRIEIYNPGGLYGSVTPENFGKMGATDYRNPNLAEAMKVLGYVQKFGMGIPLAFSELMKNGNPAPKFEFQPTGVLVTVQRSKR